MSTYGSKSTGPFAALCCLLVLPLFFGAPRPATAQEARTIGYSIAPRASYIRWDDALGLQNNWMWGAAFDFHLGQRVRLSPFFLTRSGLGADPATVDGTPTFPGAQPFDFDARHLGVDIDIDLAQGNLAPFLRLGGGVLRMEPTDAERLDRVTLTYGGGLRFGLERAAVELSVANTMFRLSPEQLYAPTTEIEDPEDSQNNLVFDTRVTLPLSDQPSERSTGVLGASGAFDLYAGELDLDLPQTGEQQRLLGLSAGASFSDLLTLSGFYWRGVTNDFDATEDMQGYGAEARFDLGTGTGVTPFLVAGGGRLDFEDDIPDTATAPGDRTALILGAGLGFRLTDRVNLQVAARDYLLDPSGNIDDAADPSSLRSNWQYTGGVSVQLGGRSARSATRTSGEWASYMARETERYERALREAGLPSDTAEMAHLTDTQRMSEMHRRMEAMLARGAMQGVQEGQTRAQDTGDMQMRDMQTRDMQTRDVQTRDMPTQDVQMQGMRTQDVRAPDGRVFTLPVLDEGTVYIRFGSGGIELPREEQARQPEPGTEQEGQQRQQEQQPEQRQPEQRQPEQRAVTPDDVRRIVQAELRQPGAEEQPEALSRPSIEERLDQIERQLEEIIYNLDEGLRFEPEEPAAAPRVGVEPAEAEAYVRVDPSVDVRTDRVSAREVSIPTGQTAFDRFTRWDTWDTRPYSGVNFEEDATQALFGARFDFGPLDAGSALRFVPEVAVGIGEDDPTLLAMGNVQYTVTRFGGERNFAPYLVGGAGLYSPTLIGLSTGIGVSADLLLDRPEPIRAFVEWGGVNLFDRNRLMFGISLAR